MYFVFDVESMGLYGEDFAVAYVVVDRDGTELDAGFFSCPYEEAARVIDVVETEHLLTGQILRQWGEQTDRDLVWVKQNVIPHLPEPSHRTRREMHNAFWEAWVRWKERGASAWVDCGYPVESNFLRACVFEDVSRIGTAPFPLMEIDTARILTGTGELTRSIEHLPAHDPLNDARHSARILVESIKP